jgi:protein phosphatase
MRDGALQVLTEDHSYVDEQVRMGAMTPDQARLSPLRNIITRAVGSHARVQPDVVTYDAFEGDLYLLCSDGLTRELDDEDIEEILHRHGGDLTICAEALVRQANEYGGSDNITVILVRV